ncbi:MAG: hypothetical protein ABW166_14775 [Sedimenticola sp.]
MSALDRGEGLRHAMIRSAISDSTPDSTPDWSPLFEVTADCSSASASSEMGKAVRTKWVAKV